MSIVAQILFIDAAKSPPTGETQHVHLRSYVKSFASREDALLHCGNTRHLNESSLNHAVGIRVFEGMTETEVEDALQDPHDHWPVTIFGRLKFKGEHLAGTNNARNFMEKTKGIMAEKTMAELRRRLMRDALRSHMWHAFLGNGYYMQLPFMNDSVCELRNGQLLDFNDPGKLTPASALVNEGRRRDVGIITPQVIATKRAQAMPGEHRYSAAPDVEEPPLPRRTLRLKKPKPQMLPGFEQPATIN